MKELLLYSPIWDFTAEALVNKINEIPDEEDIKIRVNSPGGSVFAGWSIIGKMNSRKGKTNLAVDGHAASMAFMFVAFADDVEALDVTRFMVHKATGYVQSPQDKELLDGINVDLMAKLKKKIDPVKFKEITGKTIEQLFKAEEQTDIWLTAKQAKEVGLINRIVRLEPKKLQAYTEKVVAFMDFEDNSQGSESLDQGMTETEITIQSQGSEQKPNGENNVEQKTIKKMTKVEFKASDPTAYAEILNEGRTSGENDERERVKSWIAFIAYDPEGVIKAIKEGTPFTQSVMAEMTVKMSAKNEKKNLETDAAGEIKTDPPAGSKEKEKVVADFEKEVGDGLNLKSLVI